MLTSAKSAIAINAWRAGFQLADYIDRSACPGNVSSDDTKHATFVLISDISHFAGVITAV